MISGSHSFWTATATTAETWTCPETRPSWFQTKSGTAGSRSAGSPTIGKWWRTLSSRSWGSESGSTTCRTSSASGATRSRPRTCQSSAIVPARTRAGRMSLSSEARCRSFRRWPNARSFSFFTNVHLGSYKPGDVSWDVQLKGIETGDWF